MNSWEMTEVEKSDYERFVANHEAAMRAAEFDPEMVAKEVKRGRDFLNMGLWIFGTCVIWAILAVFCWGGNLVPRW